MGDKASDGLDLLSAGAGGDGVSLMDQRLFLAEGEMA